MSDFIPPSYSLTKRLYVALTFTAALVFTVFFVSAWWTESRSLETMLQQNGRSLSAGLEQSISLGLQLGDVDFIRDGAANVANIPNVLSIDIYDSEGNRLVLLGGKHALLSQAYLGKAKHGGVIFETLNRGRLERAISVIHAKHGEFVGYSVLDLSRAGVNKSVNSALKTSGLSSVVLLLLFWWLMSVAIRRLKQPLDELDHAVESVTHGQLNVTVDAAIPDPLGRIARGFNRMTQALAKEEESLRLQSKALEASERRFRELFTHLPVAMYIAEMDGKLLQCNPTMAKLFGYESSAEMLKRVKSMTELYATPEHRDVLVAELILSRNIIGREVKLVSKQGMEINGVLHSRLVVDEDGKLGGVEGMIQDMTEFRQLESNLLQAQKMEVVGQLAGGVAHDFNNLLSVMLGNTELLAAQVAGDSKACHYAKRIRQAGKRATELTGNLLGFSRKGDMRHEPVVVPALLEEVIGLMRETGDRRVKITLNVSADNLQIIGDPGQLHQVFMNLAVNAMHAMPDGGDLVFDVASKLNVVLIRVKDTGIGMTKKTMNRMFEPFFTTRETGKGTGLGLSMVYGIIEKMGGNIVVESEPGQGTTFEITLPLLHVEGASADHKNTVEVKKVTTEGHVLLVDDEPLLREVGEEILSDFGFDVTTAASGEEALAILSGNAVHVDIVLLDLNMPGLGGVETLRTIRRNDENMKVIVLSGYSETTLESGSCDLRYDGFITKPYQFSKLCGEVSRVLES